MRTSFPTLPQWSNQQKTAREVDVSVSNMFGHDDDIDEKDEGSSEGSGEVNAPVGASY